MRNVGKKKSPEIKQKVQAILETKQETASSKVRSGKVDCFIIMPFSKSIGHTAEHWTEHYEKFLKPLVEESGVYQASRSVALRGDILSSIIRNLVVCPVVVADLTDANPNVYWELGVRQSFKHGTITIAEDGTKLPFDINRKGTLFYANDYIKNEEFRIKFKSALNDCSIKPDAPDSQVLETLSGRGTLYEILKREEAIRRVEALISEAKDNLDVVLIIKNIIEKKLPQFPASRLGVSCLELLVTTRYLDVPYEKNAS